MSNKSEVTIALEMSDVWKLDRLAQTESLKAHYRKMSEEYRAEARYCEGKQWWHLAAVQHKLADGWLAKIK